jgi:hypothetical protein
VVQFEPTDVQLLMASGNPIAREEQWPKRVGEQALSRVVNQNRHVTKVMLISLVQRPERENLSRKYAMEAIA